VHAEEFYAHFDTENLLIDISGILGKLASLKIPGIDFRAIIPVEENAHARFDAQSRTYEYRIIRERNPFLIDLAHYVYGPLDINLMNHICSDLLGKKDFGAFSKSRTQVKTNICNITEATWFKQDEQLIFRITADRFLRNMVRAIVGTLIETGQGKRRSENLLQVIESKSRSQAGMSVPACGLFLSKVVYPYPLKEE
jgi:tRNA pseudouridine38-40 synthase